MAVDIHTHETVDEGGTLLYTSFRTGAQVSIAGFLTVPNIVDISLTAYCYFPMLSAEFSGALRGHATDGASADAPRFALRFGSGPTGYAIDYNYLDV